MCRGRLYNGILFYNLILLTNTFHNKLRYNIYTITMELHRNGVNLKSQYSLNTKGHHEENIARSQKTATSTSHQLSWFQVVITK